MSDPTAPLTSAESLKVGDVIQIAIHLDKDGGYWWKRFAVVYRKNKRDVMRFTALNLKMQPNLDLDDGFKCDIREIDLRERLDKQVVTWMPQDRWPQGVVAMHMKYVLTRVISIEGDE